MAKMKKTTGLAFVKIVLAIAIIFLIAAGVMILSGQRRGMQAATGRYLDYSYSTTEPGSEDVIEIGLDEFTRCCSFISPAGREDSCYVLKQYNCSFCEEHCA